MLFSAALSPALSAPSDRPSAAAAAAAKNELFAGARRPVVVVPVREDPGLEEPKILQIGTPELEEL